MIIEKIKSPEDLKNLTNDELTTLSGEIRQRIIEVVSKNGGHLASNLGVVELTLAVHKIFNSPTDKIIWDVGHQCYTHKIITGRNHEFDTLRQKDGISGFPKIEESEHDVFNTGHSSTSISAAQGIEIAREQQGKPGKTVAIIGDGALTGGMAFEALNYTGHLKNNLVVILNDNEMSISANVGAMSMYLHKLRLEPAFTTPKDYLAHVLKQIPGFGTRLYNIISRIEGSFKYLLTPGMFFEELGFKYFGPIDGYDFELLERALVRAKERNTPVLVHVLTQKGKGYKPAESKANKFHGVGPFEVETGNSVSSKKSSKRTYTSVFGETVCKLAEEDERVVAITAAMEEGTGLDSFSNKFPTRFFDVGIAEQHAVTMAAGMAQGGLKPFVAIYSTFLQRAYDQVLHDVALMNLPVVFCLDRAGLVGEDGETHHGLYDIPILRVIPNLQILSPADGEELELMLEYALKEIEPVVIRYPRNVIPEQRQPKNKRAPMVKGKSEIIRKGSHIVLWTVGDVLSEAIKAVETLKEEHIGVYLINTRFIKPFDTELLKEVLRLNVPILTIEESMLAGGFGSLVVEKSLELEAVAKIYRLGVKDRFVEQGTTKELKKELGLDAFGIVKKVRHILGRP